MFLAELDTRGWTLRAIWLTHAHVDHIMGVGAVKRATGAPIHLHPLDRPIYDALPQFGAWARACSSSRRRRPTSSWRPGHRCGSAGSSSRSASRRGTRRAA